MLLGRYGHNILLHYANNCDWDHACMPAALLCGYRQLIAVDRAHLFPGNHGSRYEVEDNLTCTGGDDDKDHVFEGDDHHGGDYLSRDVRMCVFLSSLRTGASKRLAQVRSRSLEQTTFFSYRTVLILGAGITVPVSIPCCVTSHD